MLFKSFATFGLLATTLASPLQHQHQHQKRDVKVVTQVDTIFITEGYGADQAATASSVVLSANTDVSVSSGTFAPQVQPTTTGVPTTLATSATSGSASTDAPSSGSVGGKGVTYSPYASDGTCKSSGQIASDLAQLGDFEIIRIYAVDCSQAEAVLANLNSNQKLFAGIFDVANLQADLQTLISAVNANGGWGKIHTVSIGNELVNSGQASPSQIGSYVSAAKSTLQAAGYTGPVVAVDTFIAVINNPELCAYSDYIAVNAHCFFDGHYTADQAGSWVLQQIQRVYTACGGSKNVFITESGWPSQGDANGNAIPSVENQSAAIGSISSTVGDDTILFTAFNDLWKSPGAFNAEQYWGILN